jgi:hypothetical protein
METKFDEAERIMEARTSFDGMSNLIDAAAFLCMLVRNEDPPYPLLLIIFRSHELSRFGRRCVNLFQ